MCAVIRYNHSFALSGCVISAVSPRACALGCILAPLCGSMRLDPICRLARGVGPSLQLGDIFRDGSLLQQVVAWALFAANGAGELGHEETGA